MTTSTVLHPLPTSRQLAKATITALAVAAVILVTIVLPAEHGIDPLRTGRSLGLTALSETSVAAPKPAAATPAESATAVLEAKAKATFGEAEGQSFDAAAFSANAGSIARHSLTISLEPGKGAEVKATLKTGDGWVFHWTANAPVAVDMHGERSGAKNTWTSYSIESAQQSASGTFVAPFDGTHGWYWKNNGQVPVEVTVEVVGFQTELHRP